MKNDKSKNWYSEKDVSTTFIKGLRTLEAFDVARSRLTLPEIGEATGYDRATVRRLVATLVESGHVQKQGRHFALTPTVLTFANSYLRNNGIGTVVQPILDRFSDTLSLQVSFARLAGDQVIYVAQSHNKESTISFGFTIGSRLPVLHTALGRTLLAYEDSATAKNIIQTAELEKYCADTIMDRNVIGHEVDLVREQGYAVVKNEFENGIAGIAVPVGPLESDKGVIGISLPSTDIRDIDVLQSRISALQVCAQKLDRSSVVM